MQHFKLLATVLGAALLVAACGGGGNGDQSPAIKYSAVVTFGDSLSDPGAYNVGGIKALGGGMFTVNGIGGAVGADPVPSYTWAQLVSAAAIGKVSCAAREGGFTVPVEIKAGCTNYAQGGSRVSDPRGPGNTAPVGDTGAGDFSGALTEPVVTQVVNFLAASTNNRFTGTELVTVLAGANDLFGQATILTDAATATGAAAGATAFATSLIGQLVADISDATVRARAASVDIPTAMALAQSSASLGASADTVGQAVVQAAFQAAALDGSASAGAALLAAGGGNFSAISAVVAIATAYATPIGTAAGNTYATTIGAATALTGMELAANQLAASVKDMISKGATRVVVVNLPDVSKTPYALGTISGADNSTQQLVLAMTMAFNTTLQTGLAGTSGVLFVDAFSENQRQIANPAHYKLTNVKAMACNLGNSLTCVADKAGVPGNLIANVDTSHYLFADSVHPTPYGHKLLAQYVTKALVIAGWL
jgi:phospholipase/lecithinase/hemolysin